VWKPPVVDLEQAVEGAVK